MVQLCYQYSVLSFTYCCPQSVSAAVMQWLTIDGGRESIQAVAIGPAGSFDVWTLLTGNKLLPKPNLRPSLRQVGANPTQYKLSAKPITTLSFLALGG